jgi:hypothetical protein
MVFAPKRFFNFRRMSISDKNRDGPANSTLIDFEPRPVTDGHTLTPSFAVLRLGGQIFTDAI